MSKSRKKLIAVLIILFIVLVLLLLMFLIFRISDVKVVGNEIYTEQEVEEYIFGENTEGSIIIFYLKSKFGSQKDIPFIEKYSVEITSFNSVKITVYEKNIAGCIEYMGNYMYFDKDGMVVESSDEILEGIPLISGLKYDYLILNEQLPIQNESVFDMLLDISQMLEKFEISVDKIYVSEDLDVTLSIGNVKVNLGSSDLNEKLSDLDDLYDNLDGYSGTLDMTELDTDGSGYTMKVSKDK